jgi:hypothetical protein
MPHAEGGSAPVIINLPIALNTQTLEFTSFPRPAKSRNYRRAGAIDALQNDQQG